MSEPSTQKYGFTESQLKSLIGDGSHLTEDDLVEISVDGENEDVSRLGFELMAASSHNHWKGKVKIPENATTDTKLWATVKMSPALWELYQRLIKEKIECN